MENLKTIEKGYEATKTLIKALRNDMDKILTGQKNQLSETETLQAIEQSRD